MSMETIFAFSDSHGSALPQKLVNIALESKYVFFLGDGLRDLGDVLQHKALHAVAGNCDLASFGFEREEIVEIGKHKILLTHGDRYGVQYGLTSLSLRARELECDTVFYGHTHFASIDTSDGITFICPGSVDNRRYGRSTYAYAVLTDAPNSSSVVAKIVDIAFR